MRAVVIDATGLTRTIDIPAPDRELLILSTWHGERDRSGGIHVHRGMWSHAEYQREEDPTRLAPAVPVYRHIRTVQSIDDSPLIEGYKRGHHTANKKGSS